jgi:hypothetical protein
VGEIEFVSGRGPSGADARESTPVAHATLHQPDAELRWTSSHSTSLFGDRNPLMIHAKQTNENDRQLGFRSSRITRESSAATGDRGIDFFDHEAEGHSAAYRTSKEGGER